jgi:hypothetical protein
MRKQRSYLIALLILLAIIPGLMFLVYRPQVSSLALTQQFESNAFSFRYPGDWAYQIPQTNMLFLASPEVMQQQAGATISIQRSLRLSAETDNLTSALNVYLERGPLRRDRAWTISGEIETIRFDGREALFVAVEGSEEAGSLTMRSEITITQGNNGFLYIFTVTAPLEQWQAIAPSFQAILATVRILE